MSFDPSNITQEQRDALWTAWVEALESGKYAQTQRSLERLDLEGNIIGDCCLGVACRVFDGMFPGKLTIKRCDGVTQFDGSAGSLPEIVADALGVSDPLPVTSDSRELAVLNDAGTRFTEIASIIRSGQVVLARRVKVTAFAK